MDDGLAARRLVVHEDAARKEGRVVRFAELGVLGVAIDLRYEVVILLRVIECWMDGEGVTAYGCEARRIFEARPECNPVGRLVNADMESIDRANDRIGDKQVGAVCREAVRQNVVG